MNNTNNVNNTNTTDWTRIVILTADPDGTPRIVPANVDLTAGAVNIATIMFPTGSDMDAITNVMEGRFSMRVMRESTFDNPIWMLDVIALGLLTKICTNPKVAHDAECIREMMRGMSEHEFVNEATGEVVAYYSDEFLDGNVDVVDVNAQ